MLSLWEYRLIKQILNQIQQWIHPRWSPPLSSIQPIWINLRIKRIKETLRKMMKVDLLKMRVINLHHGPVRIAAKPAAMTNQISRWAHQHLNNHPKSKFVSFNSKLQKIIPNYLIKWKFKRLSRSAATNSSFTLQASCCLKTS